jgi:hypothetical protein
MTEHESIPVIGMVRAGQEELVCDDAESVTYQLPEQQACRRA